MTKQDLQNELSARLEGTPHVGVTISDWAFFEYATYSRRFSWKAYEEEFGNPIDSFFYTRQKLNREYLCWGDGELFSGNDILELMSRVQQNSLHRKSRRHRVLHCGTVRIANAPRRS